MNATFTICRTGAGSSAFSLRKTWRLPCVTRASVNSNVRLLLTFLNRTPIIVVALISVVIAVAAADASQPQQKTADCGHIVDGVQICLASSDSNLRLVFANVGDRDVTLNLGIMLANGKVQLPDRVAIKFTDAQGKSRLFKFGDKRYGAIAGRVDDYVVPLRVGSTYSLQLTLDQFWCQETNEFSIPPLPGNNYLAAQFEGVGANAVNLDMPGIKLMNFWLGKVESNILTLHR